MTFQHKPGHGALFKNEKKSKDIQSDYKGSLCLEDGSTVQIAGWVTQGKNGKYLALKAQNVLPPTSPDQELDGATHK